MNSVFQVFFNRRVPQREMRAAEKFIPSLSKSPTPARFQNPFQWRTALRCVFSLRDLFRLCCLTFQKDFLVPEYYQLVGKDIQAACLDSYDDFGQHMMDRYIKYADYWLEERDYRDPDTGQIFSQKALETELELIEMPMEVRNNKDFRHEVVNFCLRHQAKHNGKNPNWKSYQKLREVIEASLFKDVDKLIGVLSFDVVKDTDQAEKNAKFVANMKEKGYTEKQIRRNVEWYQRYTKSNK